MAYFKSSRFLGLLFLIVTLMVGCISMIVVSGMLAGWNDLEKEVLAMKSEQQSNAISVSDSADSDDDAVWIIRTYEERIGVFNLNGSLEYVVDVYVITLPSADQALLKQGIYVKGQDQLTALMEDYTG